MSRKQRWKTRAIIASVVVAVLVALCWPVWWTSGEGAKTVITVSPGRTAVIGAYDWVAGYVLRHVERPVDAEFPVTATSYPSGPTTAAVIGGRGHGLDCSLPSGASYAFQPQPDRMPIALRFRQACAFHDFCYRHGLATYGYLQNDCDELLQEHAFRICRHVLEKEKEGARIDDCRLEAKKITLAVRLFGSDAFQGWGDSTYYEFDPYPVRTNRFSAARLLTRDADDPGGKGLDLLRFDVVRVGAVVACAACGPQRESAGRSRSTASPTALRRKPNAGPIFSVRPSTRSMWRAPPTMMPPRSSRQPFSAASTKLHLRRSRSAIRRCAIVSLSTSTAMLASPDSTRCSSTQCCSTCRVSARSCSSASMTESTPIRRTPTC
jgi:hypothetical protein